MKTASRFHSLDDGAGRADGPRATVRLDGDIFDLPEGANLAAALLAAGVRTFRRTPVSGAPRAPFCMMGACFECLLEVDGVVRQACVLEAKDGLRAIRPGFDEAKDD